MKHLIQIAIEDGIIVMLVGGFVTLELLEYFNCQRILKIIDDFLSNHQGQAL